MSAEHPPSPGAGKRVKTDDRPKCGAKKKRGGTCNNAPEPGRKRCKFHGGRSLQGIAHPNWKHGMYDGTLPTALAEHYRAARQNPELVQLTEQVALVDAKVFELLEQLTSGETPDAWKLVGEQTTDQRDALEAFQVAFQGANDQGMTRALKRLELSIAGLQELAAKGLASSATWNEVTKHILLRKKLVDSEVKRQRVAHDMLTKDRVLALFGFIAASIARHVSDPKQKQAVVNDMRKVLGPASMDTAAAAPAQGIP